MEVENILWVEKYRPKTIEDTILPERYKTAFIEMVESGKIPNLIFAGPPGVGKTTTAIAIVEQTGGSYMKIDSSLDASKDTLRNEIKEFATSVSMKGGRKYIILDEADSLSHQIQPALRTFMETYSKNCGFILTCNYPHKIIQPLHSRCALVEFKINKADKPQFVKDMFTRICSILDKEEVEYDKKVIAELVRKHFPDIRKIIGELQRYSTNGVIDTGILVDFDEISLKAVLEAIKSKDFNTMRKWVAESDVDQHEVYAKLFEVAEQHLAPASVAQLVVLLAEYQYKAAFAVNPDINLTAALVEMAVELEFKD